MSILMWDKPKKARSTEEWAEHTGFDGGPTGGYAPNMSVADELRWKAKLVGTKTGFPQVEIRKKATSLVTIIVNLGYGYNYKQYMAVSERDYSSSRYTPEEREVYALISSSTEGVNVHISANGPIQMTFEDVADMQAAIHEARAKLESLLGTSSKWISLILKAEPSADLEAIKAAAIEMGAIYYAAFPIRRYLWLGIDTDRVNDLMGISGVASLEARSAMLARWESFTHTPQYYNRLGDFK